MRALGNRGHAPLGVPEHRKAGLGSRGSAATGTRFQRLPRLLFTSWLAISQRYANQAYSFRIVSITP